MQEAKHIKMNWLFLYCKWGSGIFADANIKYYFLLIVTEHFAECIHLHEFVQVTSSVD